MIVDIEDKEIDEKHEIPIYPLLQEDQKTIIEVRNVHKTYLLGLEGVTALRGVSFNVQEREFITILGTSGCGKTTLLNLLGSIDLPTKGDVRICGQRIRASTEDKFLASLRLSCLGFVFQTFNLISSLTALENVELPMILKGTLNKTQIRSNAIKLLEQVGLSARLNHYPNQLSGGEQQRVTIARALSNNPSILLLDEPTGDLDTKNSDLIMKIIIDLNIVNGITIIMVTHDTNLKNFSTRTIRMLDGKVANDERNDEKNRKKHIEDLTRVVKQYQDININYGVRAGTVEENRSSISKTEKRQPNNYKVLNHLYTTNGILNNREEQSSKRQNGSIQIEKPNLYVQNNESIQE
ncbi:unnamed protein product [Paramecium primaurelia]|uniref:ABC transporter domain-containing protein n=1 Tax=Paramecium primaurelia TaxID=5886 RepID=A0A8S1LYM8_PARPR|nr:unnamed protein product [Paramecium primaurelia]